MVGGVLFQVIAREGSRLTELKARVEALCADLLCAQFLGWGDQVPPATSNKRVDGERAYRKAHRGEEVVLPPSSGPELLQPLRPSPDKPDRIGAQRLA